MAAVTEVTPEQGQLRDVDRDDKEKFSQSETNYFNLQTVCFLNIIQGENGSSG